MFEEALYDETRKVLAQLGTLEFLKSFYLAGGTALAMQLGHRKSIDLDFFTPQFPPHDSLIKNLSPLSLEHTTPLEGALDVVVEGVKVSFLRYEYQVLEDFHLYLNVRVADVVDIGCMKLTAISSRGAKKDFLDLAFLLRKMSLNELLAHFQEKYAGVNYNLIHILKSLTYFNDAEEDPEPDLIVLTSWEKVKEEINGKVRKVMAQY